MGLTTSTLRSSSINLSLKGLKMKTLDVIAAVLLVVGGANWGLIGAFNFDLVASLLGAGSALSKAVYCLVGLSALYQAVQWKAIQYRWCSIRSYREGLAV